MSALSAAPQAGDRTGDPARPRVETVRTLARVVLLELRRSPVPLMLPLVAALFWFDGIRTGTGLPPVWTQRASILTNHVLPDVGPISAGAAAWIAGREHRRGMADLLAATARPRWLRQVAAWAAALAWTMAAYAVCVAVVYVLAARVATWGGPPVWPVVVAGLAVATFCTVGFVAGALFPGRFTAPLAALGSLFASIVVYQDAVHASSGWTLISPNNDVPPLDWGVFYPTPPDLRIVQTLFLLGAIAALLGAMGALGTANAARLRRSALVVAVFGLAACTAALSLAATATRGVNGFEISALHDAASDRAIPYTPVCTRNTSVPVCIHPAFAADLHDASANFTALLDEVAGLPGAPVRAVQVATGFRFGPVAGPPQHDVGDGDGGNVLLDTAASGGPVLEYSFADQLAFTTDESEGSFLRTRAAILVIGRLVAPNGAAGPAQQAVEAVLYQTAGAHVSGDTRSDPVGDGKGVPQLVPGSPAAQAAQRFAALSLADRHAWLAAHLSQLSSGRISVQEVP